MLIDRLNLIFSAGKGGDGVIAWRREKYIPKGGPAGGDGGMGGSIILKVDRSLLSLEHLRHKTHIWAQNGKNGAGANKKGKDGKNLYIYVPPGTYVKDCTTDSILFDCTQEKEEYVICKGGKGGKGNFHFKTATRQAPYICTLGEEGEKREIELDLKYLADIGLIGMPNAGKSTFLSKITKADVKIASYPFTTLRPNLAFVNCDDFSKILIADIPGIIPGAHKNKGLGISFLKHTERTRLLLFIIDISGLEGRDPSRDFIQLQQELFHYDPKILQKPYLILLNKIDLPNASENIRNFRQLHSNNEDQIFEISALENLGFSRLLSYLQEHLCSHNRKKTHT